MKFAQFALAALALATVGSTTALADTFNFSFGTPGVSAFNGSGTLTGSLVAPGEYLISAVTGTTNTGNGTNRVIAGIEAPGTFPTEMNGGVVPPNDNDLFFTAATGYTFDTAGLSYSLNNGAQINLFLDLGEYLFRSNGEGVFETAPISITAATPEPGTLLLMGTGMLGTLGLLRRRVMA